jgi:hypothetical protein
MMGRILVVTVATYASPGNTGAVLSWAKEELKLPKIKKKRKVLAKTWIICRILVSV